MSAAVRAIDISDVLETPRLKSFHFKIILLCGLVALLDGFDTQSIAFVAPSLAQTIGINITSFGPIFSAGLVGLAIGSTVFGPLADRFGRRKVIYCSTFAFGAFSLATVLADSYVSLVALRFLTGLGLGAAMPNIIALTSEFSPKRTRAWLVTLMFTGFPLGAVVGGFISAQLIPIWGWQAVFVLGGVTPMVLTVVLVFWLPESVRFLVHKGAQSGDIISILSHINPSGYAAGDNFICSEHRIANTSVRHLFKAGRALTTLLLWVPFFMNLLLLFFMYNWLPPVLQAAGLPITRAIIATVLFNLGGVVGGLVQARLTDKYGPYRVLGPAYLFGAIFVAAIGFSETIPAIMTFVTLSGACVVGAQIGANVLAASLYPTAIRATGVGWALGVGRLGSIIGPIVGGFLLSLHWPNNDLFLAAAVPSVCGALAVFFLSRRPHHEWHPGETEPDLAH